MELLHFIGQFQTEMNSFTFLITLAILFSVRGEYYLKSYFNTNCTGETASVSVVALPTDGSCYQEFSSLKAYFQVTCNSTHITQKTFTDSSCKNIGVINHFGIIF